MNRDNDIIKALGYVALYSAYLEEGIDIVMQRLSSIKNIKKSDHKLPTSQKIKWCKSVLSSLQNDELNDLINLLEDSKALLEERNEVIHGRIYANNDRSEILKSGRKNIEDREVTASELYDLAEEIFKVQAAVPNIYYFETMKSISKFKNAQRIRIDSARNEPRSYPVVEQARPQYR